MSIEIRLLTLEERVALALLFHPIEELSALCKPSIAEALTDPVKVHRIHELLSAFRVPVVSTELDEDHREALATGQKPVRRRRPMKLGYAGVLSEEMGERLTELFNLGQLDRDGLNNKRPVIHFTLTVPEERVSDLIQIHAEWLKSRVSIPLESEWGDFWISPEHSRPESATQHFIAVPTVSTQPIRELSPALNPRNSDTLNNRYMSEDYRNRWREVLDEMVREKPELSFVHFMLYHFLQPIHVQEIHRAQLKGKALGMEYRGTVYRVVGVTPHGTLQVTTRHNQCLLYEATFTFMDVARTARWFEMEDPEA